MRLRHIASMDTLVGITETADGTAPCARIDIVDAVYLSEERRPLVRGDNTPREIRLRHVVENLIYVACWLGVVALLWQHGCVWYP